MSAHLARAQLFLQQSRPADAEREAGLAIAQAPDQPEAYAVLALSRLEQDNYAPALEAARTALGLAPDVAHFHYIHALVLHHSERNKDALPVIQEAIHLDPADADHHTLLAAIHLSLGDWSAALAAAEAGLTLSPEHTGAANFRSMALVRLGRKTEAMATVDSALARDPESAFSHANQGWNCLHKNDPRRAQEHFREALRLNPELDYAREGLIEALKARNPVYRVMLAYFLWMGRLSPKAQWGVILGIYFGRRFLGQIAKSNPALQPYVWPVLILASLFIYLTWTAQPLFNLLLRLHPVGRHALSRQQRWNADVAGVLFFGGLALLITSVWRHEAVWLLGGLAALVLVIPVTIAFNARPGAWRWGLGCAAGVLALCALAGTILTAQNHPQGLPLLTYFFIGNFMVSLASNFGQMQRR